MIENLPIYYQLLIVETDIESQSKIDDKLKEFVLDKSIGKYSHPESPNEKITLIQALAHTLLDLRSKNPEFREKAITRYLSFKFSVQINLINEWHKIKAISTEEDYYNYFTSLSLTDVGQYQQSIATLDSVLEKFDIMDTKLSFAKTLFLIDCINIQVINYILMRNFQKAAFELQQLFIIINNTPFKNKEGLFKSIYWLSKHKELILAINEEDTIKINRIILSFKASKSEIKDYYTLGLMTSLLGLFYFQMHDYDKVEELLTESSKFFGFLGSERLVSDVHMNIFSLKVQQGDILSAMNHFEKHLEIFQSEENLVSSIKLAILMSEIYRILNDNVSLNKMINWILIYKDNLFRVREIDYWILLHTVAINQRNEELLSISNDKIEVLFLGGSIHEDLITIYNIRKTILMDYAKGDFEKARLKIVDNREKLVEKQHLKPLYDLDLDYIKVLLNHYEISSSDFSFKELLTKFSYVMVYIKSTGYIESQIILNQALIYLYLSAKDFTLSISKIRENQKLIGDNSSKNKFLAKLSNDLRRISSNIENFKHNLYLLFLTEINKRDLVDSFNIMDVFEPTNEKFISEIWSSYCIKNSMICIATLQVQRLSKFDLKDFNIARLSGMLKSFS